MNPAIYAKAGVLTVNGIVMQNTQFCVTDVTPLWQGPKQRGENLFIPGRSGRIAMPKRADETTYSLPMLIDGTTNPQASIDGELAGMWSVISNIRASISDPRPSGDGTVSVSLSLPSGTVRSGYAHADLELGEQWHGEWRAMLKLTFPDGGLS